MNTNQPTSGVEAAALLAGVVPALARVEMYPQWSDGTGETVRRQRVTMYDAADRVIGTLPAARLARRVVMGAFPDADWDRPQSFTLADASLHVSLPVVDAVPLWLSPAAEDAPSAGALLEQRHQVEDPAEPPLGGAQSDFARSVADGFVTLPDWSDCDPQPAPARPVADVPVAGEAL